MADRAVCFDVMGTLFDLAPVERRLAEVGAPDGAFEAWLGRTLHAATSLTLAGDFAPFTEIAEATLRSLLVRMGLDEDVAPEVLSELSRLDPYPEAPEAVELLASAGVPVLAVTNGGEDDTLELLDDAGLADRFEGVVATEHVGAYKPKRPVYDRAVDVLRLPPSAVTLIAAHGWDVLGARAAGLDAIWVSRVERRWPLPLPAPAEAPDLRAAASMVAEAVHG